MSNPIQTLVLTGYGINCDRETANAFERAGSQATRVHLNDLIENTVQLNSAHILAVPGGFSFGDDIASGRVLANRLRYQLGNPLQQFVADGKLVIGICNGFQVLVKMGLLPSISGNLTQEVTLTHNDSARFEDRWVWLDCDPDSKCVWTLGMDRMELPIRHGEGKFVATSQDFIDELQSRGCIALRYAKAKGGSANGHYPANPNGSMDDIAGICDRTGRVFGLMPHPEAFLDRTNHPRWTREELPEEGQGLAIFKHAVTYAHAIFG